MEKIWLARWNQNIEESMQSLAALQVEKGWGLGSAKDLLTVPPADYPEHLEAMLLKSSLLRARGQNRESSIMLAKIERTHRELGHRPTFRMYFELGIDHWISDAVPQALNSFLLAEPCAESDSQKVFTLSNLLWCLEALDLERNRIEQKLSILLEKTNNVSHVREQMDAYLLRKTFYSGAFVAPTVPSGQSRFFTAWVHSLPYYSQSLDENSQLEMLNEKYLWQSSYRMRTLTGTALPTDIANVKLGDAIDRLYLWIWQWLAGRSKMTSDRISFTLKSIATQVDGEFLARENQLLLRNSLAWLHLIEPSLVQSLNSLRVNLCGISSSRYPLLEREFLYINNLREPPGLYRFAEVVPDLPRVKARLEEQERLAKRNLYDLVVDLGAGAVECVVTGEVFKSHSLAQFFSLLAQKNTFVLPELSSRQMHNLVSRAKRVFSGLQVSVHHSKFILRSARPRTIIIRGDSKSAISQSPIKASLHALRQPDIGLQAARVLFQREFTREEIEKTFKMSKASACRWIQQWVKSGKLHKNGLGKGIKYQWKNV